MDLQDYGRRKVIANRFYMHGLCDLIFITGLEPRAISYDALGESNHQMGDPEMQEDFCAALMQLRNKEVRMKFLGGLDNREKEWIGERLDLLAETPFELDIKNEQIRKY